MFLLLARSMRPLTLCLQPILSRAAISASPHVRPIVLVSFSTVLRQVALGLSCFLFPWGVHLRATLEILLWDILKICPSHLRRCLLVVIWIGSEFVMACNSKFEMVLGRKIRQIMRRHPLWNASILWKSISSPCQHSDPYSSTNLTILLKRCKDRHAGLILAKAFLVS